MKHGSLQNQIMGNSPETNPEVGMGATYLSWSDRHPYTVVEVLSATRCVVQADKHRHDPSKTFEMGHQDWLIEPDLEGHKVEIKKGRDGQWYSKGGKKSGMRFALGYRTYHYDWSF